MKKFLLDMVLNIGVNILKLFFIDVIMYKLMNKFLIKIKLIKNMWLLIIDHTSFTTKIK